MWQETRPVLLAKVLRWKHGVHYLRLPGAVPVLPPITAVLVRTAPSWPHQYASWPATRARTFTPTGGACVQGSHRDQNSSGRAMSLTLIQSGTWTGSRAGRVWC